MTGIIIGLLTAVLVLDCLLLVLLVLIQLPKKEAGMGQAFGGGATDALFGAGSGNALTKLTKYSAGIFFILAILISLLNGYQSRQKGGDNLKKSWRKAPRPSPPGPRQDPGDPGGRPHPDQSHPPQADQRRRPGGHQQTGHAQVSAR